MGLEVAITLGVVCAVSIFILAVGYKCSRRMTHEPMLRQPLAGDHAIP